MKTEKIDDIVCEIMTYYGPDGHIDGHKYITAFIEALLIGKGEYWVKEYKQRIKELKKGYKIKKHSALNELT